MFFFVGNEGMGSTAKHVGGLLLHVAQLTLNSERFRAQGRPNYKTLNPTPLYCQSLKLETLES